MADADPTQGRPYRSLDLDRLPRVALNKRHLAERRIVGLDSRDARSRAFNLLRTRLTGQLEGPGPHLVGITSATPGAGKSFISANLAISLAKVSEGDVVLVDLDLRRGTVATELGLDIRNGGLGNVLRGEKSLQDVGIRIESLPFTVIPAQIVTSQSAELLSGNEYSGLIDALRRLEPSTVVLFDLPPVFANDDAMLSVGRLDGYILVVDSTETSKGHVDEAMSMLSPGKCFGTVLNRYNGRMFEKYGYGSSIYAKYYDSSPGAE